MVMCSESNPCTIFDRQLMSIRGVGHTFTLGSAVGSESEAAKSVLRLQLRHIASNASQARASAPQGIQYAVPLHRLFGRRCSVLMEGVQGKLTRQPEYKELQRKLGRFSSNDVRPRPRMAGDLHACMYRMQAAKAPKAWHRAGWASRNEAVEPSIEPGGVHWGMGICTGGYMPHAPCPMPHGGVWGVGSLTYTGQGPDEGRGSERNAFMAASGARGGGR